MPVSIRVVLSLGIAFVTIVAATIAFAPTYLAGLEGIRSAVRDLRTANLGRTQSLTQAFFADTSRVVSGSLDLTKSGVLDWDITNPVTKAKWYEYLYTLMVNNPATIRSATISRPLKPNPTWHDFFFIYADGRFRSVGIPYLAIEPNATAGYDMLDAKVAPIWLIVNGVVYYAPYPGQTVIPLDPLVSEGTARWMEVQKYGPDLNTSIVWVPAEIGYSSPQFTVLGFMRDKTGSVVGTLTILLDAETIGELLRTLGLRRRSRGFCADVESQMIVGMSWNETLGIPTALFNNFNIPGWMRLQIKTMTNMSDPLVSEAVRLVGAQSLLHDPTPFYRTIKTKQYGNTYVDAVSVTGAGLNIRIILVMPEIDFLEQIQSTQGKTIGGVAGAIVFLIVVAFLLGHLVTAPFVRLRDRMYMTATLQDDGTVDPPSLLAEVSEMQESYEAMRGELSKVKSYLPQSVLVTLYGNGEEEDEDEEGDIQGMEKSGLAESGNRLEMSARSLEDSGRGSDSPNGASKYRNRTPKGSERVESDRHSTRSSTRSAAGGPQTKGLNTATNLAAKRVTVAVFNLRGFHDFCGRSSTEEIAGSHSRALESITRHIAENRGVVDFFHGDRLQASFNAVSHCPGHMKRGAMTALHVVKEFSKSSTLLHASAGLSTGAAHVGNMGTAVMKRFCVLGPVVTQAALLERMTRLFPGVSILCPSSMFPELSLELLLQSVAIVRLPGVGKPRVIASVEGSKKMASDEWMYQLKEGESGDPFLAINQFFEAVSDGDKERALQLIGTLTTATRDVPFHGEAEALRLADTLRQPSAESSSALLDYGLFYNKCVAPV